MDALHCNPWAAAVQGIFVQFRRNPLRALQMIHCNPALQLISSEDPVEGPGGWNRLPSDKTRILILELIALSRPNSRNAAANF
jgi:hypothetical protein